MSYKTIVSQTDLTTPMEIQFESDWVCPIREIDVKVTASAGVANRLVNIYMMPSLNEMLSLVNELKAAQFDAAAHYEDLTEEELTPTAVDYAGDMTEAIALANGLKDTHNAMMAALDDSDNVDLTCYEAAASVTADDATSMPTLITLLNNIRLAFRKSMALLDVDPSAAVEGAFRGYNNYPTGWSYMFISRNMPYLLPIGNYNETLHAITAEQTRTIRFHVGAAAEVSNWGWLVDLSSPLIRYPRMSLWVFVTNGQAADSMQVAFEATVTNDPDHIMPGVEL